MIPIGGSSPIGALGYVAGTLEYLDQLARAGLSADRLYYASGSRARGGARAGRSCLRLFLSPHGVAVSAGEPEKKLRAARLMNEAATLLGLPIHVDASELVTDQRFIGEGYGIPSPECVEAIRILARAEAILLDPVYTGKAMAGLIADVRARRHRRRRDGRVSTHGGAPALFAHADALGVS